MTRTRVKICGITRVEDARAAVEAGADAIGLVFHGPSPRCIDVARAAEIVHAVAPFVTVAGLFVNAPAADIESVLARVPLALLQFHGEETPQECARHERAWIKALRMRADLDLAAEARRYAGACGLLLDSYERTAAGGTGRTFDWQRVPREPGFPLVLAGGLNAANVGEAIARVRPYAVDVSSGVEGVRGVKDAAKMSAFLRAVQAADQARS